MIEYDNAGATLTFDQNDAIYRLAMGYDVRAPDAKYAQYSAAARANLAKIADPNTRWVAFDGLFGTPRKGRMTLTTKRST